MLIQILDVLIGLAVVYLVFSSAASSAAELLESILRRRGALLRDGIRELLRASLPEAGDDKSKNAALESLVRAFYNSPHIASLFGGTMTADGKIQGGQLPSYIGPESFAAAILWLSDPANTAGANSEPSAKEASSGTAVSIPQTFEQLARIAAGRASTAASMVESQRQIASYFQASTERFSGWYRRHVQLLLFVIGLFLATTLNVDTLRIAQVLSEDPVLRAQIVEQALEDAGEGELAAYRITCEVGKNAPQAGTGPSADAPPPERLEGVAGAAESPAAPPDAAAIADCDRQLKEGIARRIEYAGALGLPLGWEGDPVAAKSSGPGLLQKALGLLLTALAICMGAPFWFDLLNQLSSARTSLKPTTKKQRDRQTA